MLLSLSSAALPRADVEGLIEAGEHRGFGGLELREGDGHEIRPDTAGDIANSLMSLGILRGTSLKVAGYEVGPVSEASETRVRGLAAVCGALDTMLVVGEQVSRELSERIAVAASLRTKGVDTAVLVSGESVVADADIVRIAGFTFAWEADASWEPVGQRAQALLSAHGVALRYVRLLGAGPESELHTGSGIGRLFGLLAQSRFARPVVLAPSTPAYRSAWERWLGRRAWGCGGRAEPGDPVGLTKAQAVNSR